MGHHKQIPGPRPKVAPKWGRFTTKVRPHEGKGLSFSPSTGHNHAHPPLTRLRRPARSGMVHPWSGRGDPQKYAVFSALFTPAFNGHEDLVFDSEFGRENHVGFRGHIISQGAEGAGETHAAGVSMRGSKPWHSGDAGERCTQAVTLQGGDQIGFRSLEFLYG